MTQTKVDIASKFALFTETWQPKIIGQVDNMHVKIARIDGVFDWHSHPEEDEMFFVVEGAMDMEFRDRTERVGTGEMIIVPKGVEHRPASVGGECKILMIERAGTVNTGDNAASTKRVEEPEII
ncbi:MAG: cupin domain-containing protein [Pseudomonadota bacterium]